MRIGIVGTGDMAAGNYLPVLRERPDVHLAVYNRTSEKALAVAKTFDAHPMSTLAELVKWKPDIVFVLTHEQRGNRSSCWDSRYKMAASAL